MTHDLLTNSTLLTAFAKTEPDTVTHQTEVMRKWLDDSLLPRSLMCGTKGMISAGKQFLFPHALESDASYEKRLNSSTLLNAYRKTANFLAGQVFQSSIVFDESIQSLVDPWIHKVDVSGNALDVFAKRVFYNGLGKGVSYILIDMDEAPETIKTVADEKAADMRPYFTEIKPENVLGGIVNEDGFLEQVRILEVITKRHGTYATKLVPRIRVVMPGNWELYEISSTGTSTLVGKGSYSTDKLPFVVFIPGREYTILTGETPLMDLADLNAKHWRSMSDQDNYLSYCRFPLYFGKHLGDVDVLPIGRNLINSEDDNGDLKTVEMTGSSIEAGRQDLKDTEALMALYGLQQLVPRSGNVTATEKALTSAESNSALSTWATEFESVLIEAFKIAASFINKDFPDGGITINKEYSFGVADAAELQALLKAQDQGVISAQACFSEFRRRGIVEEQTVWEDIEDEIEKERQAEPNINTLAGAAFGGANE